MWNTRYREASAPVVAQYFNHGPLVLSKCRLISFEAKAPQPTSEVHDVLSLNPQGMIDRTKRVSSAVKFVTQTTRGVNGAAGTGQEHKLVTGNRR